MEIHIFLAGEQLGPYSETQVRQYLGEGLLSPSDLATREGMEDWQPVDLVLAKLPPSAPTPETIFPDAPLPEPPPPAEQTSQPAPSSAMRNDATETLESPSAPPPADSGPPLTTTQRTKRKLGKIVIQPILPLETTPPVRQKKTRTGKTALTLEPLRPTTSLPHIKGFMPREKEFGKTSILPGQLSLRGFSEKNVSRPTATPPTAPVTPPVSSTGSLPPPLPAPKPLKNATKTRFQKGSARRIPRKIIYACAGLALLLGVFLFFYLISAHDEASSALLVMPRSIVLPSPNQIQNPEAVPKTAADYNARGSARQSKGDLDGAISDFNQALGLDPRNVDAFYQRGLARQGKGDWAGALADYTQVLGLDPKQADAYSNRGYVKQAQGDFDGALADYTQALILNPKIPAAYYNEGLIKVQKGDLDGAIAAYNHALDLNPKMDIAFYNRGVVKNTEGNVDGAIADYTQALALNPKLARAYCDRGIARQSKGDPDGALADYSQALALNPKMANAFYNRSLIEMQKGDMDGAIADSTQAIDLAPKVGQAYYKRGLSRLGKGSLDDALADLQKFCELVPRDTDADAARLYVWLISTEQNPRGNADAELSTSLQNDWNSPPEDLTSKIAAFLLGHIREGDLIANAASPDPRRQPGQYCKVWYFAGMKRLLAGDMTTAITDFQKCVATDQKDFCEYIFAQAELQALGQGRENPPKAAAGP
jgi:tetratricopeptide (TPR) repeat protein